MAFTTVALIGRYQDNGLVIPLRELADLLRNHDREVIIESTTAISTGLTGYPVVSFEEIGQQADLAIVMGGDGTVLGVSRNLAKFNVPIVGINHGRLGFITDIPVHGARDAIEAILKGEYTTERRDLLYASVVRDGVELAAANAFNDVVIHRTGRAGMIEVRVDYNDEFMYSERSDGLIVSTATGSTAYSLSVGGPILHPAMRALIVVPIAPQSLSHRPIVVPDDGMLTLTIGKLNTDVQQANIHFDMQSWNDVQEGDQVKVRRSRFSVTLLHPKGYSYFSTLRQKLNWNALPQDPDSNKHSC